MNKMNVKVIKNVNDNNKPDIAEVETMFYIGQNINLKYDIKKQTTSSGYSSISTEEEYISNIGLFEITKIFCNMLVFPYENMIELKSLDKKFLEEYPTCKYMTIFEGSVINRLS